MRSLPFKEYEMIKKSHSLLQVLLVAGFLFFLLSSGYAAPCYGTKMPQKNKIFIGAQTHSIFKRYLKNSQGKLRSWQNFFLLSYGVFDWLSLDLKGGAGYIKQHPSASDELNYSAYLGGGYGFRLTLYDAKNTKAVFGFQHISIHPKTISLGADKHKAVLDDWQFSCLASYDFKKITPYLGVRWSRLDYIHWVNGDRKLNQSDLTKSVGFIFGFDLPLAKNCWLNTEGQLFDSAAAAFSLNYSF